LEYFIIPAIAFLASSLAFFSGFGLGTILLPAFAIFFPVNIAVALTAIVHLLNHIFRVALLFKHINKDVIIRFGLITVAASVAGALLLTRLANLEPLFSYHLFNKELSVTPIKLTISILILFFAFWEALPSLKNASFDRKYMPLGGLLSGFFGGLSGIQGPIRSAFLVKAGLDKQSYIATNTVIAIMVDVPRVAVYAASFSLLGARNSVILVIIATLAGFLGALLGNVWLTKVTMKFIQVIVSIMLFGIALALGSGII
jgi:uncharacterized protein